MSIEIIMNMETPQLRVVLAEGDLAMKRIALTVLAATLLVGCSTNRGGVATPTETNRGWETSPNYNPPPANDLDDLGSRDGIGGNQRANGQARIPDRSIDINTGP